MPWIRVDDHFDGHPKLAAVGPVGWGVWLAGLAYCNRNLTDGFIPYAAAEGIGGSWRVRIPVDGGEEVWSIDRGSGMHGQAMDTQWVIDLLIGAGLWEPVMGGYRIHDYADFQPTKAQVIAERAAKQAAGRAGGLAAAAARATADAQAGAVAKSKPVPNPNPVPLENVPLPRRAGKRVNGTNPRALGTNPRAQGTSIRQEREAQKRGGLESVQAILNQAAKAGHS